MCAIRIWKATSIRKLLESVSQLARTKPAQAGFVLLSPLFAATRHSVTNPCDSMELVRAAAITGYIRQHVQFLKVPL